jgi:hypothetical protein
VSGGSAEPVANQGQHEELEGEVLDWLAADTLEPPQTAAELVRGAVERHLPGAVDGLARLASSATDEDVRLRAIRAMLDLAVVLGVIEPGAGSLEAFVRSLGGSGRAVVAALPAPGQVPGRED